MPGSLFHAKRFAKLPYVGMDGEPHWEVEVIDGDVEVVSHTSWREMMDYCSQLGVSDDVWPMVDCECAIDVPFDEVDAMQSDLHDGLSRLTAEQISGNRCLSLIAEYVARGEQVFFTN